jgi:hypothetical protein
LIPNYLVMPYLSLKKRLKEWWQQRRINVAQSSDVDFIGCT